MSISYFYYEDEENNDLLSNVENNELIVIKEEDDSFVNSIHEQISAHYNDFPELLIQERGNQEDYFFN